jgi:hypothetical protein
LGKEEGRNREYRRIYNEEGSNEEEDGSEDHDGIGCRKERKRNKMGEGYGKMIE